MARASMARPATPRMSLAIHAARVSAALMTYSIT